MNFRIADIQISNSVGTQTTENKSSHFCIVEDELCVTN